MRAADFEPDETDRRLLNQTETGWRLLNQTEIDRWFLKPKPTAAQKTASEIIKKQAEASRTSKKLPLVFLLLTKSRQPVFSAHPPNRQTRPPAFAAAQRERHTLPAAAGCRAPAATPTETIPEAPLLEVPLPGASPRPAIAAAQRRLPAAG